jgi:hypothetical protein
VDDRGVWIDFWYAPYGIDGVYSVIGVGKIGERLGEVRLKRESLAVSAGGVLTKGKCLKDF